MYINFVVIIHVKQLCFGVYVPCRTHKVVILCFSFILYVCNSNFSKGTKKQVLVNAIQVQGDSAYIVTMRTKFA